MNKIITVTGCLGFLGTNLTKKLLSLNYRVIGIDSITYVSNKQELIKFLENPNFKFIHSDINDLKFLYDTDIIIHTAASSHVSNSILDGSDFIHSNINGSYNLLELIKNYRSDKKPKLIWLSTDEVYGDITEGSHNECSPLKPSNIYSATKASSDMLLLACGRTYDLDYNIIRPTNMYGIYQYPEKLIPKTIKFLSLERHIPLHNNGTPRRVWLNVEDLIEAILLVIQKGKNKDIYNVSGNFESSNKEIVSKIIKLMYGENKGIDGFVDYSYNRISQDVRYNLDDSKIRELGWFPKKNINEELPMIVDFYKNNFIW